MSCPSGNLPARHISYMRLPIFNWISLIVSLNDFVTLTWQERDENFFSHFKFEASRLIVKLTACPRNDSTLKLLVRAGKMRNATTVTSGLDVLR